MAGGGDLSFSLAKASVGKATPTPAASELVCRKRRRERMTGEIIRAPEEGSLYRVEI
jgi:hypothetical protein